MGETVQQDTGLLGFTTKHIYFSGPKKKFRVRYDRIVGFEPFSDWVRNHAGHPDREAAVVQNRGRVVRLQPSHQPGADIAKQNPTPSRTDRPDDLR